MSGDKNASVLEPDSSIRFPNVTVLRASAGSGKTRTLTARYVQFLLTPLVPMSSLRNVLAVTFSNNASREMRENILLWLKSLHFRDSDRMAEISSITDGGEDRIARKAGETVERVLSQYTDFQVKTIDSFMSTVLRASAVELGLSPDFRILMDPAPVLDYAFDQLLRDARPGSAAAALLNRTVAALVAQRSQTDAFPWEPGSALRAQVLEIEKQVSMLEADPVVEDTEAAARGLAAVILRSLEEIARRVQTSGLEENPRSAMRRALALAQAGLFADIAARGLSTIPVKRPPARQADRLAEWEAIAEAWRETRAKVGQYSALLARGFYAPYLRLRTQLSPFLESAERVRGEVFISDVNRKLLFCLSNDVVPDIYFRIGERVFHYLVDEFQDTSPIQWKNLSPLIENSLAQGGSLFVVGDTKQAIYGFRHADYTIMRGMEERSPFPSVRQHTILSMQTNFRSRPAIIRFAERVFRENAVVLPQYRHAAGQSGLDDWHQAPKDRGSTGHVEVEILERNDADPPERARLHAIVEDLRARGYRWGDIAVLASRNDHVVKATSWLNERLIPFISYSSLDVRRRKTAGEVLALLEFLDSPKDDLSFVTFLLGDIFAASLSDDAHVVSKADLRTFLLEHRDRRPLYKAFQGGFPGLWRRFFEGLFRSAGYLPLYDLASEIFATFGVFQRKPDEEATLAKLLEAIKDFEGQGSNSLRDFLRFSKLRTNDGTWDIDVPQGADSVKAMTIHKAKGLGFAVAIVLLYGERSRGFGYTVERTNGQVKLVKLTRKLSRGDEQLSSLYDREQLRDSVNKLNGLYVALTRAREEMYVIGVKRQRDSFPFDLLPEPGASGERGQAGPSSRSPEGEDLPPAALSHEARPVPPAVRTRGLSHGEQSRGDLAHAALCQIQYASASLEADIETALGRAAREMRLTADREIAQSALRLIRRPPLAELFTARQGRSVFTEWEICDERGRLFRLDRVVLDPDRVTVIDWKTGAEEDQTGQNEEQVANYARILRSLYGGRDVQAYLAYLDLGETRHVV